METGLLHLHNALRWVVLVLLLLSIIQAFSKKESVRSTSLFLMIASNTMLLIGVYKIIGGRYAWGNVPAEVSVMKDKFYRFYLVEHPLLMILAVTCITWARSKAKN
ncbi:MAG: cytochrome B, partial [bacterium]